MNRIPRTARTTSAVLGSAALLVGFLGTAPAQADTQVTAVTGVNVRSAPSTGSAVVGGLYRGQTVTAVSAAGGWTRVRFAGSKAYIASRYLAAGSQLPAQARVAANAVKVTTTAVNLRRGPGLSYGIIRVLPDGTRVSLTGKTARGFAEVTAGSTRGWVSAQYLASSASGLPKVTGVRIATTALDIRTSSGSNARVVGEVKKGTKLSVTGAVQNGRAQIVYRQHVRWVTARYLTNPRKAGPAAPRLPKVTGVRYATTGLLIRSTSDSTKYTVVADVPKGTALSITGVTRNGRSQVVYRSAVRWVLSKYLSRTKPAGSAKPSTPKPSYAVEKGLSKSAIAVHRAALKAWPAIRTYYGYRNDPSSDHYRGQALDLMIPNYKTASGHAYGGRVAAWARANQKRLDIHYVIWNQHIWNVQRASEGWRPMGDRGDDSANHKNHVHISVQH